MRNAMDLPLATISLERFDRVLVARYATRDETNFVTRAFVRDLDRLTKAVDGDDSVSVVVLTGGVSGRFITHADVQDLGAISDRALPRPPLAMFEATVRILNAVFRIPGMVRLAQTLDPAGMDITLGHRWKQTLLRMNRAGAIYIAAINGPALGAGHEIALACDLRFAADSPDVVLGQTELLAGLIPGGGATQRLSRMIGAARAIEHVLQGVPVSAAEAYELGLVHRLIPADSLLPETLGTARMLAGRSRHAVAAAKRCIYFATDRGLPGGLDRELAAFLHTGYTSQAREAASAFKQDFRELGDTPFVAAPALWVSGDRGRNN